MNPPVEALRKSKLFQGVEPAAIEDLAARAEEVHLVDGATLFRPGEASTDLYLVVKGKLRAQIPVDEDLRKTVSFFEVGDHFGEFSFLSGAPRSAAVEAEDGPATVLRITQAAWKSFEKDRPAAALHVFRTLALALIDRLRRTNDELGGFVRWGLESLRLHGT